MELRGVVVHTTSFDESSRVVELLTAEEGRLACVARGARASKRRFAGGLDLFATLAVEVSPGGNLWRLERAGVVDPRVGIRSSLEAFERAGRITECARALTNAHQRSTEQLSALEAGLDACARGDLESAITAYPRLLTAAGIMPDEEGLTCAPEVLAALLSGDAPTPGIADSVEVLAMKWIEHHVGHPLKTRVTPVAGSDKRHRQ